MRVCHCALPYTNPDACRTCGEATYWKASDYDLDSWRVRELERQIEELQEELRKAKLKVDK